MTAHDKINEEFLQGLKEIESILLAISFKQHSVYKNGFAYYIQYKRGRTIFELIFGPSEWHIEPIIRTRERTYELKDLLAIPAIAAWLYSHRYVEKNGKNLKDEMSWCIELLKFSLPIIE